MNTDELLSKAREIWGNDTLSLDEIIVRQNVTMGDVSRYARDKNEGKPVDEAELKKELGNIIFSMIRWCDDLGYSPEECISLAEQAQRRYVEKLQR